MRKERLRRLFLRYREHGDVEALTEVFDATAPALLTLACQLSVRRGDPEDALQSTFLTAIERRDTSDASQPLLPWLTGILIRKARGSRAGSLHRPESELPEPHSASDPLRDASEAELSAELSSALSELPERYRMVLLPFLQSGDRPAEIASRLGLAAGTVRVQIHRGLEQLRRALPTGYAAGGMVPPWTPETLAALRAGVASAAKAAVPAGSGAGGVGWVGGVVPRVAAAGVALVLAGAGGWRWMGAGTAVEAELAGAPNAEVPVRDEKLARVDGPAPGPADLAPLEAEEGPGRSAIEADPAPPPEPWTLSLRVRGLDIAPPSDLVLEVRRVGPDGEFEAYQAVPLTSDGPLDVRLGATLIQGDGDLPRLGLHLAHGAYAPLGLPLGAEHLTGPRHFASDLELVRTKAILTGRVIACGSENPRVGFFPRGPRDDEGQVTLGEPVVARCGHGGAFQLYVEPQEGWWAADAGGCGPAGEPLILPGLETVDLGTIELGPGAYLEGSAVAPGGSPAGELRGTVIAERVAPEGTPRATLDRASLLFLPQSVERAGDSLRIASDGGFRVDGLTPGDHQVLFVADFRNNGYYDALDHGVRATAPARGLLLESPVSTYTLRVVSEGDPVADAKVFYDLLGSGKGVKAPTRPDGSYPFSLPWHDEAHRVEISKQGFETLEFWVSAPQFGPERELEVELHRTSPAARLTLDLEVADGPLGPLLIEMEPRGVESDWRLVRPALSGETRLDLGEVPSGKHLLRLSPLLDRRLPPQDQASWLETTREIELAPSARETLPIALRAGGRVALEISGLPEGSSCELLLVTPEGEDHTRALDWDVDDGYLREIYTYRWRENGSHWLSKSLAPGEYHLKTVLGDRTRRTPFAVVAGTVQRVPIDLR